MIQTFSINSSLDDSGHPFPDFPHRTNTYLDNFDISPKKVADIIAQLDPSKATVLMVSPLLFFRNVHLNFLLFFQNYMPNVFLNLVFPLAGNFPLSFLFLKTPVRDQILAIIVP